VVREHVAWAFDRHAAGRSTRSIDLHVLPDG
jgi:hypothetical protein